LSGLPRVSADKIFGTDSSPLRFFEGLARRLSFLQAGNGHPCQSQAGVPELRRAVRYQKGEVSVGEQESSQVASDPPHARLFDLNRSDREPNLMDTTLLE
jgi:hypothetical protein